MKTKLGETVPEDLTLALQEGPGMLDMWDKLRPLCQRRYVELVTSARRSETRERRVKRVLERTEDYYLRHLGKQFAPAGRRGVSLNPLPVEGEGKGEGDLEEDKINKGVQQTAFARRLRQTQTDAEKILWGRLRSRNLLGVKFRRQ